MADSEIGRCGVCGNTDYLERIPLIRGQSEPEAVDLKTCEKCKRALRDYFATMTENGGKTE